MAQLTQLRGQRFPRPPLSWTETLDTTRDKRIASDEQKNTNLSLPEHDGLCMRKGMVSVLVSPGRGLVE